MTMFGGAWTALVTPFRAGAVDEAALCDLVEQQVASGIQGLVPCGTTGENVNLSDAEYAQVVSAVVKQARGRVPVIAGAGGASTRHMISLARLAKQAGVDGLLSVVPYYNRPTQEGLFAHYSALTASVDLPVVLYNIPSRTGTDLSMATLSRLADNPRFVAVKEATGTVQRSMEILAAFGDRFTVLSGDDLLTLPVMAAGGHGVISVVSHLVPQWVVGLVEAMRRSDLATARELNLKLMPIIRAAFLESNPGPIKAGLSILGRMDGELRLPLVAPTEATQSAIRSVLKEAGKL